MACVDRPQQTKRVLHLSRNLNLQQLFWPERNLHVFAANLRGTNQPRSLLPVHSKTRKQLYWVCRSHRSSAIVLFSQLPYATSAVLWRTLYNGGLTLFIGLLYWHEAAWHDTHLRLGLCRCFLDDSGHCIIHLHRRNHQQRLSPWSLSFYYLVRNDFAKHVFYIPSKQSPWNKRHFLRSWSSTNCSIYNSVGFYERNKGSFSSWKEAIILSNK